MILPKCPSPEYLEFSYQGLTMWLHNSDLTVNKGASQSSIYGRNTPSSSDTGDKPESFSFSGILHGDNIMLQENAFRLASKMPLPHTLIHPVHGVIIGYVQSVRFSTDYKSSGGITTVTIDGTEWGEDIQCGYDELNLALLNLALVIGATFFKRYNYDVVPSWRVKQVQDTANLIEGKLNDFIGTYTINEESNWAYFSENAYKSTVKRIENSLNTTDFDLKLFIQALKIPVNYSPAMELQDSLIQSSRLMACINLIKKITEKKYITSNFAWQDRDFVVGVLRAEANAASSVGSFQLLKAIYALEKAFIGDFLQKNKNLPPIVSYHFNTMHNSISIAHQLYGDGSRYNEIEALNPNLTPLLMIGEIYAAAR